MSFVGKNIPRRDGAEKVTGKALYIDDVEMPGMWHGAVVRTPIPYGKVLGYELDPSFDWNQVVIADAGDIPGKNFVSMIQQDVPLIIDKGGVAMHIGEAVALIAAPTREMAYEARRHVKVLYDEWKPVLTMDESKKAAIKIRGDDNVVSHYTITKGDIKRGMKAADEIVEGTYEMGYQEHMYIETNGMIASPATRASQCEARRAGRPAIEFEIVGSMQCPYYISKALSFILGMPEEKISVRQADAVGGAFGGKEDYPSILAGYCAVLAGKTGRPVKIVYDRAEDTEVTTKRHPARVAHKTGVKKDGTITAMDIFFEMDAGAYATMTPVVLSRGIIHADGAYRCANVKIEGVAYATNKATSGAFRGFGVPQAFFPIEVHIDRVAERIGMSPLKFRRKNMLREGDTRGTGQRMDDSIATKEVLEEAVRRSDFESKFKKFASDRKSKLRRGIGMSFFCHGTAFTGSGEEKIKARAGLRLDGDGRICVLTACTDMGQGAHTVIPQMAADHLGIDLSLVAIERPDTALVPNSGPTVASRTTLTMGMTLKPCAGKMKDILFAFASERTGKAREGFSFDGFSLLHGDEIVMQVRELVKNYIGAKGPLEVIEPYTLPPGIKWDDATHSGDAYPTFGWGCDVAEVEVDMETFEVNVCKMCLAQDAGRAINPQLAEGQIEGGTLQSLGYGLMERHLVEAGRFTTGRLQTYIIPTFLDTPEMETVLVEKPYRYGPMGAKGIGEMPMNGAAPAIANAIYNATGIRICELPMTSERLYEKWRSDDEGRGTKDVGRGT